MILRVSSVLLVSIFMLPWFSVVSQIGLGFSGVHRFEALSITNKLLVFSYAAVFFVSLILYKFEVRRHLDAKFIFIVLVCFVYGIFRNPVQFVVADMGLIAVQFFSFFFGYQYRDRLKGVDLTGRVLNFSLWLSVLIGCGLYFYPGEVVSPMFLLVLLLFYKALSFDGLKDWCFFWVSLVVYNTLFAFGKQDILVSFVMVLSVYMSGFRDFRSSVVRILLGLFFVPLFISLFYFYGGYFSELGSFRKVDVFLKGFDSQFDLIWLFQDPMLAYSYFDLSTAGRVSEFFILINSFDGFLEFSFGGGLGFPLDFRDRDAYTSLFYEFGVTRSVQTLPVFLISRFGFVGSFLLLYFLFKAMSDWAVRERLFVLIALFMSCLAFSTVFKYPFLLFMVGYISAGNLSSSVVRDVR